MLLVGEAAGIDIATGEGIAQAIEYGAAAGRYLADAFASDNLRFGAWRSHVDRSYVGRQLAGSATATRLLRAAPRGGRAHAAPGLQLAACVGIQDFARRAAVAARDARRRGAGARRWSTRVRER